MPGAAPRRKMRANKEEDAREQGGGTTVVSQPAPTQRTPVRERPRVVAALGGNALLRRGEPQDAETQLRNVKVAVASLGELAREADLVVTHGNGPQVGLLALQAAAYGSTDPLDVLGAESEGMIGYLLAQALGGAITDRPVAALLTQVRVAADDPAFTRPTKPIGPVYPREEAERLAAERGWAIAPDTKGFRRVVASPDPLEILEIDAIRILVEAGVLVVCAGGGGVPVVADRAGAVHGVEAVIDKDLAAALLARLLDADALLLLTDVRGVEAGFGTPDARLVREGRAEELLELGLPAGSMRPKVEAARRFVEATAGLAAIGALHEAAELLHARAGTRVLPATDAERTTP
ncbi:MAG TPA: carbamate kinase [Gaiellaceae bacterium]|nr:carbamate kinase [Gaiellaceae bacterium]